MRESQKLLNERRIAVGRFATKHREYELKNIKINYDKVSKQFKFSNKVNGDEIDSICIKN